MTHKIAAITFVPRTNDGPLDCTCGEGMLASEFTAHRKANGQPNRDITNLRSVGKINTPSMWNRQGPYKSLPDGRGSLA